MLSSPEWLAAKLRLSGIEALIEDCDHLIRATGTPLLLALSRNNTNVLSRLPNRWASGKGSDENGLASEYLIRQLTTHLADVDEYRTYISVSNAVES